MRTKDFGTLVVLTAAFFNQGCGASEDSFPDRKRCATTTAELTLSDGGISPGGAASRGLLLSTTENYESSRLFFFDFATGKKSQLMSGESGDPGIFTSRGETFFFNRGAINSNLRSIEIGANDFALGVQTAISGAGTGDPQSIIHLDDRHLLMSLWASSKLGVFDLEACEMLGTYEFPVDLGSSATSVFRPSTLIQVGPIPDSQTYVIHQGINSDSFSLNGSQQIFEVKWNGSELSLVDNDAEKDLIQGIPLIVSNPTAAFINSDNTLNVVGSCTILNSAGCVHGIEKVDLVNKSTVLDFDFSPMKEKNNGSVVAASEKIYYMQMLIPGTAGDLSDSKKFVAQIDLWEKTITETYTYPETSGGCCGLFYETQSKKLIVTEFTPADGGKLFYIDENKNASDKIAVENNPFSGIILSF